MKQNENAFTGLEAAIVLIAFVVVAAVFSYVMLGAGFFTAQEAQSVVHTGMGQAASSIEVVGDVYGFAKNNSTTINQVSYTIALTAGNQPMDISNMRVTYAHPQAREILTFESGVGEVAGNGTWRISRVFDQTSQTVLSPTGKFQIQVAPNQTISANERFTISMQPEVGALTTVVRTAPGSINPVQVLR